MSYLYSNDITILGDCETCTGERAQMVQARHYRHGMAGFIEYGISDPRYYDRYLVYDKVVYVFAPSFSSITPSIWYKRTSKHIVDRITGAMLVEDDGNILVPGVFIKYWPPGEWFNSINSNLFELFPEVITDTQKHTDVVRWYSGWQDTGYPFGESDTLEFTNIETLTQQYTDQMLIADLDSLLDGPWYVPSIDYHSSGWGDEYLFDQEVAHNAYYTASYNNGEKQLIPHYVGCVGNVSAKWYNVHYMLDMDYIAPSIFFPLGTGFSECVKVRGRLKTNVNRTYSIYNGQTATFVFAQNRFVDNRDFVSCDPNTPPDFPGSALQSEGTFGECGYDDWIDAPLYDGSKQRHLYLPYP